MTIDGQMLPVDEIFERDLDLLELKLNELKVSVLTSNLQ
jgi:hypothetical protein